MPDIALQVKQWYKESENLRFLYEKQWAESINLLSGVFSPEENSESKVRKRSNLFFRKIWATTWRIVAAWYQAFLRDPDIFDIEPRDMLEDPAKAAVLKEMVKYRFDRMMRTASLFIKIIWSFQNIANLGWAPGKFSWRYDPDNGIDEPEFTAYPPEQVYPDLAADTKENMRYIIFESFLTMDELKTMDFDNLDKIKAIRVPQNQVRDARFAENTDPLQNPHDNEYAAPGRYTEGMRDMPINRYKVWEVFYRQGHDIWMVVTDGNDVVLKKERKSPYGRRYPVVLGQCLLVAHKLIGENFPHAMKSLQESINATLNMRKDNVAQVLQPMAVVARYVNVDLASLLNRRVGGIVLADDPNAVVWDRVPDVTSSSFAEVGTDQAMMDEISGIPDIKRGMGQETKATVAQINLSESNTKIDLYTAIVGETFFREFFSILTYLIQRFEEDEKIFRIANSRLASDVYVDAVDDFEADCTVDVGLNLVGKELEIRQLLLAMDRAIMSNQGAAQLLSSGQVPPDGIEFINIPAFMRRLLPKLGLKNNSDFFIKIFPQQGPGISGGIGAPGATGTTPGGMALDLQQGGFGGL